MDRGGPPGRRCILVKAGECGLAVASSSVQRRRRRGAPARTSSIRVAIKPSSSVLRPHDNRNEVVMGEGGKRQQQTLRVLIVNACRERYASSSRRPGTHDHNVMLRMLRRPWFRGIMADLALLAFAEQAWAKFAELDALSQLSTIVGLFGPIIGLTTWVVRRLMRRTVDDLRLENKALSDLRDANIRKIEALQREVTALSAAAPATILERMERERRDGNEVLAIRALIRGFEAFASDIGRITHELALHHLSTLPQMPRTGLAKAERFARIAVLCQPDDRDRQYLLAEIIEIKADRQDPKGADAVEFDDDEAALEALFGVDVDVPTLVVRLCDSCHLNLVAGYYRSAERLALRAVFTARGRLGPSASLTLTARYWHTAALSFLGRYDEALDAVEALLPLEERVKGAEHPNTLNTRYLRASILHDLGRSDEALDAVEALLPLFERVEGAEHPDTLTTRYLGASILRDLGRSDEALDAVEALLPLHERVKGAEHPDTLSTRGLRASILRDLGRSDEALDAVDALLPLAERVKGAEHPDTLSTRSLRASILRDLGRSDEALDAVEALLPLEERVKGAEHPDTLSTRSLRASILRDLGRSDEALDAVEALLPLEERVKGAEHPDTLTTRSLRASILHGLGRSDEAHESLQALLPRMAACLPINHPLMRSAQALLTQLEKEQAAIDQSKSVL
ncbi:tetratricopeptide repeat protein [Defluviicoccus vanus]|uniref:tetratricopeptide repeat protein n=1 Tax=Defluviicoccus vanus TaxID=111831 RepID=UPI001CBA6A01|nr:tetratricopeptide repeat protein [Defluviicoccus vanus]